MPQPITINGYKFQELDEKAKDRVKEWYNQDWQFEEWDREYWTEELGKLGYEDVDMSYSGFWSQGDGASIACKVDLVQYMKRNKLCNRYRSLYYILTHEDVPGYVEATRATYPHYVHDGMLSANADDLIFDLERLERFDTTVPWDHARWTVHDLPGARARRQSALDAVLAQVEALVPDVLGEVRAKSRELYKWLQDDYEYRFTDEYMIENCDGNDYLFTKMGKPVSHLAIAA